MNCIYFVAQDEGTIILENLPNNLIKLILQRRTDFSCQKHGCSGGGGGGGGCGGGGWGWGADFFRPQPPTKCYNMQHAPISI